MDINERLLLDTAWKTGHFWDADFPDLLNVDQSAVAQLTLKDRVAKYAMVSLQKADANLEDLVRWQHGRALIPDGEVGPATIELVNGWNNRASRLVRCPLPDFTPPPNASFHYDDPDIQKSVERMQKAGYLRATGSGSWPATDGVHVVTISYDLSNAPASIKGWFPEIKRLSHDVMAACGVKLVEVPVGEFANIRVSWRVLAGSTIGLAEYNNGTLRDSVFCYLDPGFVPDLVMVLILLLHENGHNWNCNHRPGYIMNPSIRRVKPTWVERDSGLVIIYRDPTYTADLIDFFGGGPIESKPVPTPIPTPTPIGKTLWEGDVQAGRFKLMQVSGTPVPPPFPV